MLTILSKIVYIITPFILLYNIIINGFFNEYTFILMIIILISMVKIISDHRPITKHDLEQLDVSTLKYVLFILEKDDLLSENISRIQLLKIVKEFNDYSIQLKKVSDNEKLFESVINEKDPKITVTKTKDW